MQRLKGHHTAPLILQYTIVPLCEQLSRACCKQPQHPQELHPRAQHTHMHHHGTFTCPLQVHSAPPHTPCLSLVLLWGISPFQNFMSSPHHHGTPLAFHPKNGKCLGGPNKTVPHDAQCGAKARRRANGRGLDARKSPSCKEFSPCWNETNRL